jgi:hypothetical protein
MTKLRLFGMIFGMTIWQPCFRSISFHLLHDLAQLQLALNEISDELKAREKNKKQKLFHLFPSKTKEAFLTLWNLFFADTHT